MKINSENWTIEELVKIKSSINPKPQYQRTPVWTLSKKIFLIDSILRNYDLPKFYIKRTSNDFIYKYEVTDGQQRMRAIWEFINNEFKIEGKEFKNSEYVNCFFMNLSKDIKNQLLQFKLTFSIIEQSTQEEIRTLFARLQMGMTLIPVELRHALASNLGNSIFSVTENHIFFEESKIINKRFKHQDYLDHVIALIHYKNKKDIKAPTLYQLYIDLSNSDHNDLFKMMRRVNKVLDWMFEINKFSKGIFKNKWGFVDTFWFLYKNIKIIDKVKYSNFSKDFQSFENKRKKYNSNPEELIENKDSQQYDKDLYNYIDAFNKQGALKNNVSIRNRVFNIKFNNSLNFVFKNGQI